MEDIPGNCNMNNKRSFDPNGKTIGNENSNGIDGVYVNGQMETVVGEKTVIDEASITDDTSTSSKTEEKPKAMPMVGVFEVVKIILLLC